MNAVIGLFGALSVGNDSTTGYQHPRPAFKNGTRALGDFSELWQYLNHVDPDSSEVNKREIRPASDCTPKANKSVQEDRDSCDDVIEKRKRRVTFEPQTGRPSQDVATSRSNHSLGVGSVSGTYYSSTPSITPAAIRSAVSAADRKSLIIQKLAAMFPLDTATLLSPRVPRGIDCHDSGIHVFIDNSNVLISFYDRIKRARGYSRTERIRRPAFSFHGLSLILERGRLTAKRVLVGSSPITRVVLEARALGYETSILERVSKERLPKNVQSSTSSGSESATAGRIRKVEQAVDEIIHLKILESILDYPPSTIVLASGDGAAGEYSPGFSRVIERCLERGWKVELLSWKQSLSWFYRSKDFRRKWAGQFVFVPLDGFLEELLE